MLHASIESVYSGNIIRSHCVCLKTIFVCLIAACSSRSHLKFATLVCNNLKSPVNETFDPSILYKPRRLPRRLQNQNTSQQGRLRKTKLLVLLTCSFCRHKKSSNIPRATKRRTWKELAQDSPQDNRLPSTKALPTSSPPPCVPAGDTSAQSARGAHRHPTASHTLLGIPTSAYFARTHPIQRSPSRSDTVQKNAMHARRRRRSETGG